jgi:uncharacterized Zn finger protein
VSQINPIPLTITRDGDTIRVHGSVLEITLLEVMAERSDRTAIKNISRLWGVDRDTARLLMHAAREGRKT